MSNTPATDSEYEVNVALSYEYIEKSINEVQGISNNTNTQLGLLIGFNFTFIRFFLSELPDKECCLNSLPCYSCLLLKFIAYILAIASNVSSFVGLYQSIKYYIIPPNLLVENCESASKLEFKLAIIDTWQEKLDEFIKLAEQKKIFLNRSILFLLL